MVNGIVVGNVLVVHGKYIARGLAGRGISIGQRPGAAHIVGRLTELMGARRVLQIAARAVAVRGALATGCIKVRSLELPLQEL